MIKGKSVYLSVFLMLISVDSSAESGLYGMYSNLFAESGEPSGMEMFFLNDGRAGKCDQSVLLQVVEGWPQYPELLDCCSCTIRHVEFNSKKLGKFSGRIEHGDLIGEFIATQHKVNLKKGRSYWQR